MGHQKPEKLETLAKLLRAGKCLYKCLCDALAKGAS